jgi:hypothetical protein
MLMTGIVKNSQPIQPSRVCRLRADVAAAAAACSFYDGATLVGEDMASEAGAMLGSVSPNDCTIRHRLERTILQKQ